MYRPLRIFKVKGNGHIPEEKSSIASYTVETDIGAYNKLQNSLDTMKLEDIYSVKIGCHYCWTDSTIILLTLNR